jgi:hypothetical protein
MQGIDWVALPTVAEMYGFDDIEIFVAQLVALRDHLNAKD